MSQTRVRIVTAAVFVATFMTAIEGTIVSTAMPTIVGSLEGIAVMNWVFAIYLLTNAMMTPIYGKLADRVGRKPVFLVGTGIFIMGSSLCGMAQSMISLIIYRAIQGIGAGAVMPVALTIIADMYPYEKRAKILGLNNSAWGIASIVGPLCGGFIVDTWSWHWIFFVNVPIGLLLMVLIFIFFKEPKREKSTARIDVLGSLVLMLMLLSLLYGFQILDDPNTLFVWKIGCFLAAIILCLLFIRIEKKAEDPVISLTLFDNKIFVFVNIIAALVSGFLIGVDVYIPMWMQGILSMKAAIGGLVLAPMSLTWILGSFIAGKWLESLNASRVLQRGLMILALGALGLILAQHDTAVWMFIVIASVLGIGFGVVITTATIVAQSSVPTEQLGVATSFNTLSRTVGQTIMISVFGVILNQYTTKAVIKQSHLGVTEQMMNQFVNPHTAQDLPQEVQPILRNFLYQGLHSVYLFGLGLIIVGFLLSRWMRKHQP